MGYLQLLLLSLVCLSASLILVPIRRREDKADLRFRAIRSRRATARPMIFDDDVPLSQRLVGRIGRFILNSGILSRSAINDLEETVAATGSRTGPAVAMFVGSKIVLLVGLPLVALILIKATGSHVPAVLAMLFVAVVGLLLPDMVVRRNRKQYTKAVEKGMPAALDLLIMCAEAGLSLEAGLERVSIEGRVASEATANEFRITANEMKILADRRQALVNIGTRTKLDSAIRLGGALAQSLKYGTPLTQALRVLSAEMRQAELTRFEEKAARIPVILTIPMILFILPCIFVVVGGPAIVRVVQIFLHR